VAKKVRTITGEYLDNIRGIRQALRPFGLHIYDATQTWCSYCIYVVSSRKLSKKELRAIVKKETEE
jgi:hypothetical protein